MQTTTTPEQQTSLRSTTFTQYSEKALVLDVRGATLLDELVL
jgi:hypothetical protein